ncbi:TfoX/Sxy family protein [Rhizobium sp. RU36D]|uniref:TfoX/Sxy family protein n=1 Tax=Rhizobium sp. RU36D TaxID=1907415 RepID=UPI0009FF5512|nr:TfoX/Sxy family protein [Rhizobium sp. RU36D]
MDKDAIEEMFCSLGSVSIKRMFGGKGIYHQGLIVALEVDGQILLKADAISAPAFAVAGAQQWGYDVKDRKTVMMPYWNIPEDAYDDPDEMAKWVRLAYEAAVRSEAAKKGSRSAKKAKN